MDVEPLGLVSQHSKNLNLGQKHSETDRANRVRDSSCSDVYLIFSILARSFFCFFSIRDCHRGGTDGELNQRT